MKIADWVVITAMIAFVVIIAISFALILVAFVNEYFKRNLKSKLERGLSQGEVSFSDFKNLQRVIGLDEKQTYTALLSLKTNIDFGGLEHKKLVKDRLDKLIDEFVLKEPFGFLPDNIKDNLILLRGESKKPELVDNFAEVLRVNIKKQSRNDYLLKAISYVGFVIGLVGFIWGFFK
ncbi:hypothetical protein PTR80_03510 [Serratia nevei]|uniref:hypothetical protein n=1 Tax=Serratia nevei TaxID=2703794 RepID=UPI00313F2621